NRRALLTTNYQYVRGEKQFLQRDINPIVRPIPGDALGSRINGRVDTSQGTVLEFESNGDSYYNALTVDLKIKFDTSFFLNANYTFSKTIDDYIDYRPEFRGPQDPLNLRGERSYSNQDVRNRFNLSGQWFLNY